MNNYENLINTVLDGRYRITAVSGTGGMGVVYEADDLSMERRVAVKVLKDEIKDDVLELKRFINESRAIAMLSHPNIVQVYDVSVKNEGEHQYIVMELIDGITLKDYISRKGRLNWREAIGYTEQILSALSHAHEKGIIHRDVKPQNVMLLRNGNLKITDFGIAKIPNSEQLTMIDKAIGTVHYISPEQANGNGNISTVSDIYSVGITLYEMTVGKLPFEGENAIKVAMMQIKDEPQNPRVINPEIPKGLSQIILKAMSKSAHDRYQTAGEMMRQLSIIKANPAAVFNYTNHFNNGNHMARNENNLPAAIGEEHKKEAVKFQNNRSIERTEAKELDENAMRRKGRNAKKVAKRRNSRSMLPIISGIFLAFLIVVGISAVYIFYTLWDDISTPADNTVKIPDYKHWILDDVKLDMLDRKLTVGEIIYENNEQFGENEIISQIPEAHEVKRWLGQDIPINFRVSKGKDSYVVEDLSVVEYRSVEIDLKTWQINVEKVDQPDDTVPRNYIIYTEPGPGAVLQSGDTLKIYVSSGQTVKIVLMPYVVGMSEKAARKELAENEIAIKKIIPEYSDRYAPGYIIEQDITEFRQVPAKSTKVTLKISMGPRPKETSEEKAQE